MRVRGGVRSRLSWLISKWVSGRPPVGFLLNQNGFVLERKERTSRSNGRECESERRGRKRRETSRTVSTKRLPQCVCSILSMSKASVGPFIVLLFVPIFHNPTRSYWGPCDSWCSVHIWLSWCLYNQTSLNYTSFINLLRSFLRLPLLDLPNFVSLSVYEGGDEGRHWSTWDRVILHRDVSVDGSPIWTFLGPDRILSSDTSQNRNGHSYTSLNGEKSLLCRRYGMIYR